MSENLCLTGQRANIVSQKTCVEKPVSENLCLLFQGLIYLARKPVLENLCLTGQRANIVSRKTCVGNPVPHWSEG